MKSKLLCIAWILIAALSLTACNKKAKSDPAPDPTPEPVYDEERALEQSAVWTLGERYPITYSSLTYFVTYNADGEDFCLKATRNKKETGMSQRVSDSRTVNGIVFSLCESKGKDADGNPLYTYYECYTGNFRYFIGRESDGFRIETVLPMDDAIALMWAPESPRGNVNLQEAEWNAQYCTDDCNLEILIRPNDGGALVRSLPSSYQAVIEGEETYYTASSGDDIAYTNGTHSVQIRQANRAGGNNVDYHTLSECKAILALLGRQ